MLIVHIVSTHMDIYVWLKHLVILCPYFNFLHCTQLEFSCNRNILLLETEGHNLKAFIA